MQENYINGQFGSSLVKQNKESIECGMKQYENRSRAAKYRVSSVSSRCKNVACSFLVGDAKNKKS